jgi:hypothetical protein
MKWRNGPSVRWLTFDIENRPLSYMGEGFTTAEITAIAWSWADEEQVHVELLTKRADSAARMLRRFRAVYDEAGGVTGHYIRKHDLPIVNGALLELELPPLTAKLTSDTKLDLMKRSGISASQQNLAEMYGLPEPKYGMSQVKWRRANRLSVAGLEETRARVVADVVQHKALREKLLEVGALGPPREWRP